MSAAFFVSMSLIELRIYFIPIRFFKIERDKALDWL